MSIRGAVITGRSDIKGLSAGMARGCFAAVASWSRRMRGVAALSVVPLLVLFGLLALAAGVARAEVPRLILDRTFPSEGPGVAVDQSDDDVYTAGLIHFSSSSELEPGGHISKFNASGGLMSSFGGEGYWYGSVAVNPANGDVYVVNALESGNRHVRPEYGRAASRVFPCGTRQRRALR